MRILKACLLLQAGAAAFLAVWVIFQPLRRLPPPLDVAGSAGRWGSFVVYSASAAVALAAAAIPAVSRLLAGLFAERVRGMASRAASLGAIPAWTVLIFHALDGDAILSAKVTPFVHGDALPYVLGAFAVAGLCFAFLALVQAFAETRLERRPRLLRVERRLFLVFATVSVGCVILEGALRLQAAIFPKTDGLGVTPGSSIWQRRYVKLNRAGFRDREFEPKKPGEYRIAVLGDSLIFGYGVRKTEDRCMDLLEGMLAQRLKSLPEPPRDVRVLNVALPGADTQRELRWLEGVVLPLQPDLVILGHFWNDIGPALKQDGGKGEDAVPSAQERSSPEESPRRLPFRRIARIWLQTQSAMGAQFVKARILFQYRKARPGEEVLTAYEDEDAYRGHLELIDRMRRLATEKGARFAVCLIPDFAFPFDETPMSGVARRLEEDLGKMGILVRDLVRYVAPSCKGGRDLWVNASDSHPNERGHAYLAEGLLKMVLEAQ